MGSSYRRTCRARSIRYKSLFPLQAALGYSIAQNLFIAKKNVLIEGPADFLLLQHMSALLEEGGRSGLEEGVFVPVGGLDKLATFIALLGASKLKLVVLHDRAGSPHQSLERLIEQKLIERKRVLDFSMFRTPNNRETDLEDLFRIADKAELASTKRRSLVLGGWLGAKVPGPDDLESHLRSPAERAIAALPASGYGLHWCRW